jgi:hypothetical protein
LGEYLTPPTATGVTGAFAISGMGKSWTVAAIPVPAAVHPSAGGQDEIEPDAESCPPSGACVAIGIQTYDTAAGIVDEPIALTGSGTSWAVSALPLPAGGKEPGVQYVDCPSAGNCTAAGTFTAGSTEKGVLWVERSGAWSALTVAKAGALTTSPRSLACSAAGQCTALWYWGAASSKGWLAASEQGLTVKAASYPEPAGTTGFAYGPKMGCAPGAGGCAAVAGTFPSSGHPAELFLLNGSGTSWTAQKASFPAGTVPLQVNPVGAFCQTGGPCVALADYATAKGWRQISWTTG